ncbi:MAG TPA: PfkB family carbohydrate kinase, partial [Planctomycetota bacterium]|nr:PfkB family carbohydrate kinase [Planctomycetota bacterium]
MPEQLVDIVQKLGRPRVLVVGDMILDRYAWGDVDRISPEAPIPVLAVAREETRLGGAASVVNNLHALDLDVVACGVVGDDDAGRTFREMLVKRGLDASGILVDPSRRTGVKTRMIARKQQVLRVDHEDTSCISAETLAKVLAFVREHASDADVLVISDYGKGLVTGELTGAVAEVARTAGIRAIADTFKQPDFSRYRRLSAITPNRSESEQATGLRIPSADAAEPAARKLLDDLELEAVVMTLDREGIAVLERDGTFTHLPTRPQAVYDVTGAGDMVISVLAAALAAGNGWVES